MAGLAPGTWGSVSELVDVHVKTSSHVPVLSKPCHPHTHAHTHTHTPTLPHQEVALRPTSQCLVEGKTLEVYFRARKIEPHV